MPGFKTKRFRHSTRTLLILGWAVSQCACASLSDRLDMYRASNATPLKFQSEDYVVLRLQETATAEDLAGRFLNDPRRAWVIEEANKGVSFGPGSFVVIPLKEGSRGGLKRDGYQTVPILCYHRLEKSCESALCMTVAVFEAQLKYLKENGYHVVSMHELSEFIAFRRALPSKAVVINLDDGYRSTYEVAYPLLKKYGFTAGIFVYTDFIGASANSLTWDQLLKMKADGFEIGSHSISHCDLTRQREGENEEEYLGRIRRELVLSKQIIDKKLNQDTRYFAFPYGEYNHRVLSLCEEAGYSLGLSVKRGGNPFFSDPLALRRDQIVKKDMESFVQILKTTYDQASR